MQKGIANKQSSDLRVFTDSVPIIGNLERKNNVSNYGAENFCLDYSQ